MHSIHRVTTWGKIPGNWDTLNFSEVFPSDNAYGIPMIANNGYMPSHLIQWGSRPNLLAVPKESDTAVHFFLDDYRFESLWNNPMRNLEALMNIGLLLSPDFSLWRDMPLAMQIWQVYRNRWLGCHWQQYGIPVIPTISWSQPHDFCYMGVEHGSILALSSVGLVAGDTLARQLFQEGFYTMLDVLSPSALLVYGSLDGLIIKPDIPIVEFPTRWESQKPKLRKRARSHAVPLFLPLSS